MYCWTGPGGGAGDAYLWPAPGRLYGCGDVEDEYLFTDEGASALEISGDGTGDLSWRTEPDRSFSTYAAGKMPCFPSRLRPVHHSELVSATISMISPARNARSFGS